MMAQQGRVLLVQQGSHRPLVLPKPRICCGTGPLCSPLTRCWYRFAMPQKAKRLQTTSKCAAYRRSLSSGYDVAQQGSDLQRMITIMIKDATTIQELEDVLEQWSGTFNFVNTSAAFVKAAKLAAGRPAAAQPLISRLARIWQQVLPEADPQGLGNVMWACGKLRCTQQAQLVSDTLAAFLRQKQADVACVEVSNVLYGLSLMAAANKGSVPGVPQPKLEDALGQLSKWMQVIVTHPMLEGVTPQDISNALLAYSKLKFNPGEAVLRSMLQALVSQQVLQVANTQAVSNTLYALSDLPLLCRGEVTLPRRVWDKLLDAKQLQHIADNDIPQGVSNSLLAMARLSHVLGSARCTACAVILLNGKVIKQFQRVNPQDIANSMFACAKLGIVKETLFRKIATSASSWVPRSQPVGITQVAYACGTLLHKQPQLMAEVVKYGGSHPSSKGRGDSIDMALMISWAVARLDMQGLAQQAHDLIGNSGIGKHKLHPATASRLWQVHCWLAQHQLLDGGGLASVLSEQQLAVCKLAYESKPAE